jgi:hypothetical protein
MKVAAKLPVTKHLFIKKKAIAKGTSKAENFNWKNHDTG